MTQAIQDNLVVTLDYKLIVEEEMLESTEDGEPIVFIQGIGQIIPGLENALYGMKVGDQKTVVIPPEEGYGEYDPESTQEATKDEFSEEVPLDVGTFLDLEDDEGDILSAQITAADEDTVTLDFNHPLAGKDLIFDVTVTEHITDDDQIRKEIISRRFPGVNFDDITIEVAENPKAITISLPNYLIFMEGLAISKYTLGTDLHEFLEFELVKFQDIFDYQKKEEQETSEEESEEKITEDTDS